MTLPFGLKTKPTRRYVPAHSIAFRESEGKLFCKIKVTTKTRKNPFIEFEVKSKKHLDRLVKIETLEDLIKCYNERQTIEAVA